MLDFDYLKNNGIAPEDFNTLPEWMKAIGDYMKSEIQKSLADKFQEFKAALELSDMYCFTNTENIGIAFDLAHYSKLYSAKKESSKI